MHFVDEGCAKKMATKSITKDIRIKDPALGRSFANALENCSGKHALEVAIPCKVREVKSVEEAKHMFTKL